MHRRLLVSHLVVAAFAMAALALLGASSYLQLRFSQESRRETSPIRAASRMLHGLEHGLAGVRGWMLLGETAFREDRRRAWEEISSSFHTLRQSGRARPGDMAVLEERLERLRAAHDRIEPLITASGYRAPIPLEARRILAQEAVPAAREIEVLLRPILAHERALIDLRNERGEFVSQAILSFCVVFFVACGLITIPLSRRAASRITEPLSAVSEAATELAAGRLRADIPLPCDPEVAELVRSFNQMRASLRETEQKRIRSERQLAQAQRLESIGRLAAGIAHEINTPSQYLADNIRFLKESLGDLTELLKRHDALLQATEGGRPAPELAREIRSLATERDLSFLFQEVPAALDESEEGIRRISSIVGAMRELSHPGGGEKTSVDLNHAIESALTVARSEWKYVAEVDANLDPALPLVPLHAGEFNQALLNLLVNAAQAITEKIGSKPERKGRIEIRSWSQDDRVHVSIRDSGPGIPEEIRPYIFDPFFTTKSVGEGTGQGLAIARTVIVDQHGGSLDFTTQPDDGTTFHLTLPLEPPEPLSPAPSAG